MSGPLRAESLVLHERSSQVPWLYFDDDPEFDLSHITARQQSREEIIAAAEAAAFSEEHTDNQNQRRTR